MEVVVPVMKWKIAVRLGPSWTFPCRRCRRGMWMRGRGRAWLSLPSMSSTLILSTVLLRLFYHLDSGFGHDVASSCTSPSPAPWLEIDNLPPPCFKLLICYFPVPLMA